MSFCVLGTGKMCIRDRAKKAGSEGESALERRRRELEREKEQVLKEKSVAADLLKQAQKDAEDLRAAAHREQEAVSYTHLDVYKRQA